MKDKILVKNLVIAALAILLLCSLDSGDKYLEKITLCQWDSYFKEQVYAKKNQQNFYALFQLKTQSKLL